MFELSCTTENAVRNAKAFKDAYNKAERAAVKGIITDVMGEEWTKKQFEAISWPAVLSMHGLSGAINIPELDTLRDYGWVEYRVEEFELPETVKKRIAANNITVTFEDGSTKTFAVVRPRRTFTVGDIWRGKRIVKVKEAWPDFKGRRYVYRFV